MPFIACLKVGRGHLVVKRDCIAAGVVLRMDFLYWCFALGTCCVAWATVLIDHSAANLTMIQDWLAGI